MRAILASRRARSQRYEEANVRFASPGGSVLGDGSIFDPWELGYAFSHLPAGNTLYLRGGTYEGGFTINSSGVSEAERRTVRSFPGEWAVIESSNATTSPLTVSGDFWTIQDLEVTNSNAQSRVLEASVPYDNNYRSAGLYINGKNCNQINLLIHDNGNGIGWWTQAEGGLSYGNIVWNNGWAGSSSMRGHGHGWYVQNDAADGGVKRIENVISTNSCGSTIKLGAQNGHVDNCEVVNSTLANSGATAAMTHLFDDTYRIPEIEQGSGEYPYVNFLLDHTRVYEPSGSVGGGVRNNYADVGPSTGLVVTNCNLRPGAVDGVLKSASTADVMIQNNIVHGDGVGISNEILAFAQTTLPVGTWDNNNYSSMNGPYYFNFTGAGGWKSFAEWQSLTGYDLNSTYTPNSYPPDVVYVEPNTYEAGRSHVTVYNSIAQSSSVSADLSGTGLNTGDTYYVFNAMNPLAGPIASGAYSGGSVNIPMNDGAAGTPADPVGDLPAGVSAFPHFGVFIVRRYATMRSSL
jgi:hypothetical protein